MEGESMKVEMSKYLTNQKPLLAELIDVLSVDFKYASVLAVDSKGTNYGVGRTGCQISDSMLTERGYVVRVFNGINYSEYSFNDLNQVILPEVVSSIKEVVINDVKQLKDGDVEFNEYPIIKEEVIEKTHQGEIEKALDSMEVKEKIEFLTKLQQEGIKLHDLIIEFRTGYEEVHISKIFYSTNKKLEQSYIFTNAMMVAVVNKEGNVKYSFDSFSGLKGVEILDELVGKQQAVVDKAVELLDATKVVPGEYEIICNPAVSGLIAHEAFGHGVEMDMFVKNRAKGAEYIDKRVGSDKTTMHDGALSAEEVGTYLFDDEGTFGTDTKVIEDGFLRAGISDILSAL
jgi:TldD protein